MSKYDNFDDEPERPDTEITLGLRSILGIFFALVLICGVFFGFGYSLGRSSAAKSASLPQAGVQPVPTSGSATAPLTTVVEQPTAANSSDPYNFSTSNAAKPSGSIPQPAATTTTQASAPAGSTSAVATPSSSAGPANTVATTQNIAPRTMPASLTVPAAAKPSLPAPQQAQSIMVQIAAISRPQDADVLVSALQKRGFNASVRRAATDSLLHVQIGPFTTRQQALAVRQQLINAGYNAILK